MNQPVWTQPWGGGGGGGGRGRRAASTPVHRVGCFLIAVNGDTLDPGGEVLIFRQHLLQAVTRLHMQFNDVSMILVLTMM